MNYLVIGLAKSGLGAIKLLEKNKENIFAYDKNKNLFDELRNKNAISENVKNIKKISTKTLKNIDYIVISPGVVSKKYDRLSKKLNIKIISELELGFMFFDGDILTITGTNGKTTTVNLLFEMIKKVQPTCGLVGNVGNSFCEKIALNPNMKVAACEASSFQLEKIEKFNSHIVGFLNIADDHLNRYKNFDEYFNAKLNIFKNMRNFDILVLNYDDKTILEKVQKMNFQKLYFSLSVLPENLFGAYLDNEKIIFKLKNKTEEISLTEISLKGKHNICNIMCSCLMALCYGVNISVIQEVLKNFKGLEHRIEFVDKIFGIDFYDDSKATNIHASIGAINSFDDKKVLLLLGGENKGEDFNKMFKNLPKNVTKIITFGKMGKKILKTAKKNDFLNINFIKSFKDIFKDIDLKTINEDVVLLSPACSSFDEFKSFEERGECFKLLVKGLKNE